MTHAQIVDRLTDGERHPRLSYSKFVKQVKSFVEKQGRTQLILTFCEGPGAVDEAIEPEELDKPRTGLYRARLDGHSKYVEAQYTNALDQPPRDPRQTIDAQYQALNEVLTVRYSMAAQELINLEGRLKTERDLRFAAEDEVRIAKRRIEDLEAELEDCDEPIFDESTIDLLRLLFGDMMGIDELTTAAKEALDAIEADNHVKDVLLDKCPRVLLLISKAAGEGDGQDAATEGS